MIMRKDLKRAVELVRKGKTYGQAARLVGVTRNAVAGACNRAGLKTGRPWQFAGNGAKRAKLAAKLYADGLTYKEIAAEMGLSHAGSVSSHLRNAGVKQNRGRVA